MDVKHPILPFPGQDSRHGRKTAYGQIAADDFTVSVADGMAVRGIKRKQAVAVPVCPYDVCNASGELGKWHGSFLQKNFVYVYNRENSRNCKEIKEINFTDFYVSILKKKPEKQQYRKGTAAQQSGNCRKRILRSTPPTKILKEIFMKKKTLKAISLLLVGGILATTCLSMTGCGVTAEDSSADYATPDDFTPLYYTSEEDVPEDTYCIVHTDGENIYFYPLYAAEHTYDDANSRPSGEDPTRAFWVNYNIDEGLVPTMYEGDRLIFKSNNYIPTKYYLEKFFDDGFTLGIFGLQQDLSKNYLYDVEDGGYTMSTSDAIGLDSLAAESVYLVSVGDTRVTSDNVSSSGCVTGLDLMSTYECDIRTGTEKVVGNLTANIHYFASAETYVFGEFTFITDYIVEIAIPDYTTAGYYDINGAGYFRYLPAQSEPLTYAELYETYSADDFNETIYTYDDYDNIEGSKDGLVLDENGFLVADVENDPENELYVPEYVDLDSVTSNEDTEETSELPDADSHMNAELVSVGSEVSRYNTDGFDADSIEATFSDENGTEWDMILLLDDGQSPDDFKKGTTYDLGYRLDAAGNNVILSAETAEE
jgi:hypothetical protein